MRLPSLLALSLSAAVASGGGSALLGADAFAFPAAGAFGVTSAARSRIGAPPRVVARLPAPLFLSPEEASSSEAEEAPKKEGDKGGGDGEPAPKAPGHDLGILVTWDLDDTLYPLTPVIGRANIAFSMCMSKLGYTAVKPRDINEQVKAIRREMSEDPELFPPTYAQLRMKAIRREMVKFITRQNLQAVAVDEGTDIGKLTAPIQRLAETKAQQSLDNSAVRTVYDAWESERHAAADANVYPDVVPMLEQLRGDYPNVVMGAVTNGAANPLKMPGTLAKHFDFCVSWGMDGIARKPDRAIYEAALEKYKEFAKDGKPMRVWIHVGDDLAYDVGGSSAVGAKTIWTDLTEDYGQTAEARLFDAAHRPAWSTAPEGELDLRKELAEEARARVTETVCQMSEIPPAVRRIVRDVLDE